MKLKKFMLSCFVLITVMCFFVGCSSNQNINSTLPPSQIENNNSSDNNSNNNQTDNNEENNSEEIVEPNKSPSEGISYKLSEDETYAIVSGYYGTDTDIVISKTYQGKPVKVIGTEAFSRENITSVFIHNLITTIEKYAFNKCKNLTTVTISNSVETIGNSAFYGCEKLVSVNIPSSVKLIESSAFNSCESLTSINIPSSVKSIGSSAFGSCTSLSNITISDSVENIGIYAFKNTAYYNNENNWEKDSEKWENGFLYIGNHFIVSKTTSWGKYQIKSGTVTIADYAFYNCSSITNVEFPIL